MIRLLLILVLAGPVELYQHQEDSEFEQHDFSVTVVVEPTTDKGYYGAPAITNKIWRGGSGGDAYAVEVFYPYMGNASYAARLVEGDLTWADLDAWIDTPITWRYHTWCWPHALPGGWRCFSIWMTDWEAWGDAIWEDTP